ncbi:hypothetical protein KY290_033655 [Solanum tuberosum]|uniref:Uncharacterized protein n=1 Tax=Solanum tuberosum TaxID=4113 RepID=A0ABQ7U2U7_SOLTU|nr:hypothetical protein KY289_033025 [Solanum tuberosum]KAH0647668.1 hypothetical protein KY285_032916 [Solanum tuberosum]KAH0740612.1 hypothetical protein KY290_033655 [Solanum tuberosum]
MLLPLSSSNSRGVVVAGRKREKAEVAATVCLELRRYLLLGVADRERQLVAPSLCCCCCRTETAWSPGCSPFGAAASDGGSLVVFAPLPELSIVVRCLFSRLHWPERRTERRAKGVWAADLERR